MGDYNVSREQFSAGKDVSRKIFQHGTRVVDADQNEQVLIDLHRQRRISYGLMRRLDQRIRDGFAFKSGGTNQVSINKGDAFIAVIADGIGGSHHIYMDSDVTVTGLTTPTGNRTDYMYLDIYFEIIDSDDDTGLINPLVAVESAVDIRARLDWLVVEGASIPSAPTGHTYIGVLQMDRLDGNANVTAGMCTNLLPQFDAWLEDDGTVSLKGNLAVDDGVTIDGTDVSETLLKDGSRDLTGNLAVDDGVTIDGTDVSETLLKDGSRDLTGNLAVDAGVTIDGTDISVLKSDHDTLDTNFTTHRDDECVVYYTQGHQIAFNTDGALADASEEDHYFTEGTSTSNQLKLHFWLRKLPNVDKISCRLELKTGSAPAGTHILGEVKLDANASDIANEGTNWTENLDEWDVSTVADWDYMEFRLSIRAYTGAVATWVRGMQVTGRYS